MTSLWSDWWNGWRFYIFAKPEVSWLVVGILCPGNIYGHITMVTTMWQFTFSAARLRHHATGIMTQYRTQSHYPDSEHTSSFPVILIPSASLGSNKYQFDKSDLTGNRVTDLPHTRPAIYQFGHSPWEVWGHFQTGINLLQGTGILCLFHPALTSHLNKLSWC